MALTLFEKIWNEHVVLERNGMTLLHIDRHVLHDLSAPPAFDMLREGGHRTRNPELAIATIDHMIATHPGRVVRPDDPSASFIREHRIGTREAGIRLFDLDDPGQGIVHVVAPESGATLPGATLVCGDSHTCTNGGLGALAFGIGSSEVAHVLATQTLWIRRPRTLGVEVTGSLGPHITAKDLALHIIGALGAAAGNGHAVEYFGDAVRALPVEARLTLCNMSVELGSRMGLIAPDETTFDYLRGRPYAPRGAQWDQALTYWRTLPSDPGAPYDTLHRIDASAVQPTVTWGTSPEDAIAIGMPIPDPAARGTSAAPGKLRALDYMGLKPGMTLAGLPVNNVFIGSCTNARLSDLRAAATVAKGRKVAASVRAMVVAGSAAVKRAAEAEGLHEVFQQAGFEWHESGCSMCCALGPDRVARGERSLSTSNRNFENRQGPGARTHLASPAMAAAAAIAGHIVDVREFVEQRA